MNMIMHGDGHGGVHHHDGLLNVNGIFEERFDVILTNPPFGARIDKSQKITEADKFTDEALIAKYKEKYGEAYEKALKQVNDNIGKSLLSLYDVGSMSGLTEVLFMERCLRLLKKVAVWVWFCLKVCLTHQTFRKFVSILKVRLKSF